MFYFTPHVIRETSQGLERLNIRDLMLGRREITLTGEINSALADSVISQLLYLDGEQPGQEITMYINSPGGEVSAGLAIYDVMRAIQSDVRTVCTGVAASMAAVLFAAGDKREILPHGEVMIHDPLTHNLGGSALDVQGKSDRLMKTRRTICEILATRTGKNLRQIYRVSAKDTWFNAEEAVQFGLADQLAFCQPKKGDGKGGHAA